MYKGILNIVLVILFFCFQGVLVQAELVKSMEREDATPLTENQLTKPKGGQKQTRTVKKPVSNYILQKSYPDTVILKGPPSKNKVALTFDDGPDPRFTPKILDVLKQYDVKATFFLMGTRANTYSDIVKRLVKEGHIIGNHTFWHRNLVEQVNAGTLRRDVEQTEATLSEIIGYRTKLFRAPYGFLSNNLVEELRDLNYTVIVWSVDSLDWHENPPIEIANEVLSNIHPGAIILMHDGGEWGDNRTNTIQSLYQIIPAIKEQGLEFVTIPELISIPYEK